MDTREATLIVGVDGWIGRALSEALARRGAAFHGTTRRPGTLGSSRSFLDLSEDPSLWETPREMSIAFLCAAETSQKACNENPSATAVVNVDHTLSLARRLSEAGVFVAFLSTDKVFDGARALRGEEEPVCPLGEYGRQKARTERGILSLPGPSVVVRMSRVIAKGLPLHDGWLSSLKARTAIRPFSDMWMAPIPLPVATEALLRISERRPDGIVQLSGADDISYLEAARRLAERLGAPEDLVRPAEGRSCGLTPDMLPRHTTLDCGRAVRALGFTPPPPLSAVDWLLE